MKKLRPIYKLACTELQTLFFSPIAWLILIVFTIQVAVAFTDVFGERVRTQSLGYGLSNVTLNVYAGWKGLFLQVQNYLYLYIPLLTMGLISREYNSGSIKLLYSSPLTNSQIVLGKYLSMIIYALVMIGILALFAIFSICTIQHADIPAILSGLLGLYLLICAYAAIGLFMSSITSYQVVAAIGTFAMLYILNAVSTLWQDIAFVRDLTYWLSISGRADEFIRGLICSEDVLYFIIVMALFLALSIIRLKAARQKARFSVTFGKYAAVVAGALLLGYLSSRPQLMSYYDATRTKANTLTPNSQDIVARMDGGLTITTYVNILDEQNNYWYGLPRNVNQDLDRFKQYTRFKPEIKMKYYYYYHPAPGNAEALEKQFPGMTDRERMVKTTTIFRLDSTLFHRPEELKAIIDLEPEGYRFVRLLERENGQKTFLRVFDDIYHHPFESEISAAFKRLVMELPKVGFLKGHGERDCIREGDRDYNRFAQDKPFRYSLINNGFDFEEVSLDQDIPEKIKIMVIADMRNPLTPEENERLNRYIERGGNLLIAGEPRRQEVMNPLVEQFGVQFLPGRLVKLSENFQPDFIINRPTNQAGDFSYILKQMIDYEQVATMPSATGLSYTNAAERGFTVTPLFTCDSTGTWNEMETTDFVDDTVRYNPAAGEVEQPYVTMLAMSRPINGKEQKIIILGDADCLSNGEISISRKNVRASNYSLIQSSFYWLSDEEVPINVTRPKTTDRKVFVSMDAMYWWKIFWIGFVPAVMLFFSLFIWIRRRGK
ncbi:MAG: Gldg family protein [Dysgonamonadaceae bacterium]|jgi:ABC-2 type transport system permease protein|nr:Gldg family protein [Dysgonamonadaceae bacterium]